MATSSTVAGPDSRIRLAARRPSLGERVAGLLRRVVPPLVIIVAVLGTWEAAGRWGGLADYVLPTPCGYEKWEFTIFPKRYPEIHTQVRPPLVAPPAQL